jgi:hypothetical protein
MIRLAWLSHTLCGFFVHNHPQLICAGERADRWEVRHYYRMTAAKSKDQTFVSSSGSFKKQPAQNPLYKENTFCQSRWDENTKVR